MEMFDVSLNFLSESCSLFIFDILHFFKFVFFDYSVFHQIEHVIFKYYIQMYTWIDCTGQVHLSSQ